MSQKNLVINRPTVTASRGAQGAVMRKRRVCACGGSAVRRGSGLKSADQS
eukprot:m.498393 g.498393  ORF g.498393 m.498393 type:complete len:50 (-) comp158733_c0_seq1:15-164(-)